MTRYHSLTPAEFEVISSGDPDAAVIKTLQSAQYSKRIVLIKAIMEAAAGRCPGECLRLEAAYGLLAAAQADDPAAVRAVLTYPGVGSWAARCLHGLTSLASDSIRLAADLGQFTAIAAAAGIRSGRAFAIDIPMRGNTVILPTLGLATMAEADSAASATVSRDAGQGAVTIIAGHQMVTLPDDPSQNGPGWQGLRGLQSCHGAASISVGFDDLDPCRDTGGMPLAGRQSGDTMAGWQAALDGAWAILARHHPRRARALATGLRCITPLERTGPGDMSVTDEAGFGGIMLTRPRDPLALADTLVHEFQHSVLSAVSDLVRLHTAGPDAVHYSPWRDDPRPIEGLLQGAYAYLGVTGYWEVQRRMLTGRHQMLARLRVRPVAASDH
jgi:HEXXH motif-containing protein